MIDVYLISWYSGGLLLTQAEPDAVRARVIIAALRSAGKSPIIDRVTVDPTLEGVL